MRRERFDMVWRYHVTREKVSQDTPYDRLSSIIRHSRLMMRSGRHMTLASQDAIKGVIRCRRHGGVT